MSGGQSRLRHLSLYSTYIYAGAGFLYNGNLNSSNPLYSAHTGNSSSLTNPRLSYSLFPATLDSSNVARFSSSAQAIPWSRSLLPTLNF